MSRLFPSGWALRDYDLIDDLVVVGFSFRELTQESLQTLDNISMPSTKEICEAVLKTCEIPLYELSILTKCNAVLLVAIALHPTPAQSIQSSLIDVWAKRTDGKILEHKDKIQRYSGIEALRYLHETAVGLQSVTLGDGQVFNQVRQAISSVNYRSGAISVLGRIESSLRFTKKQIEEKTELFHGQMSLERIACDIVEEAYAPGSQIGIIGSGMTANLLVDILTTEHSMFPTVYARNEEALDAIRTKFFGVMTDSLYNLKSIVCCDVIILALEVNAQTSAYVKQLYTEMNGTTSNRFLVIDISTPGFEGRPSESSVFHSISELSAKAAAVNKKRAAEIPAANEIIRQQIPIVAERVRMENLNRYLGALDLVECRLEQKRRSWSSVLRIMGISLFGAALLTSELKQMPQWVTFLNEHGFTPSICFLSVFIMIGIVFWMISAVQFSKTWADIVVRKASCAYTRKLIPLSINEQRLDRIYAIGIETNGVDGFVPRATLSWLFKNSPESIRAWTVAGKNEDVRCFYVMAPLSKRGVNRMLLRKIRKDSDLEKNDTSETFHHAHGMYVIEVLGIDNLAKAAILAAVKIDIIYHAKHSKIDCLFSRPVNKFGGRQLTKALFSQLGKDDHEMQMKTVYEASDVRYPQLIAS